MITLWTICVKGIFGLSYSFRTHTPFRTCFLYYSSTLFYIYRIYYSLSLSNNIKISMESME